MKSKIGTGPGKFCFVKFRAFYFIVENLQFLIWDFNFSLSSDFSMISQKLPLF